MDFNQDKGSLIREEQKIADNLVKKMSEELDELTQWIPSIEDLGYKPQESTKKGK